jgi:hypothetical protein
MVDVRTTVRSALSTTNPSCRLRLNHARGAALTNQILPARRPTSCCYATNAANGGDNKDPLSRAMRLRRLLQKWTPPSPTQGDSTWAYEAYEEWASALAHERAKTKPVDSDKAMWSRLLQQKLQPPPPTQDDPIWTYEEWKREMGYEEANASSSHAGCDSGELPPWHEECKWFDI